MPVALDQVWRVRVFRQVVPVDRVLSDHQVAYGKSKGKVGAGFDRQPPVDLSSGAADTRVDAHQFQPPFSGVQ